MLVRLVVLFLMVLLASPGHAQNFSNKGKDFWVGYGYHHSMLTGNNQDMVLYFTADVVANVKVEIPAVGWSKTYTVAPNTVTETDVMPKTGAQDSRLLNEGLYKTGIHITSDNPVVAYAHIYNASVSGATLLFPVATLGRDYYSLNFTQRSNAINSNSWAYVIATEDSTLVEIIPSGNTLTHASGTAFTVLLNKGEVYNVMGKTTGNDGVDLSGTRIRSISTGTAGCKRIAVFSGSGRLSINCSPGVVSTSDNVIQQAFPNNAWGKNYLTVPTSGLSNNFFRVAVTDPSTVVKVNGAKLTNLSNGFYYEFSSNQPQSIVADKPVMVAQYITSTNNSDGPACGNNLNGNGDPEMIYLSPTEQTIDNITLNSTAHYNISQHYINVVIKTSAVGSFTIDGTKPVLTFSQHPRDPSYSYAVFTVNAGNHQLRADSGFNAIAYGYGQTESYGYNAGTNIRDLYQFLMIKNPYATVETSATCKDLPFRFAVALPFHPTSIRWDFGNNPLLAPNVSVTQNNPAPDSTFVRDEKVLYLYRLPADYKYQGTGLLPVKVTTNSTSADGCAGLQDLAFDLQVVSPIVADFSISHTGCATDTAFFTDKSVYPLGQPSAWQWAFGDGTTDSVQNPRKAFSAPATYPVKLRAINTLGCYRDTIKNFTIAPPPTAKFGFKGPACENVATAFSDSSTISSGTIAKWYWNFGDGQTLISATSNNAVNTYKAAGAYTVTLQVENATGCKSLVFSRQVIVNALPKPGFTVSVGCLPGASVQFTNTSTISNGAPGSLVYFWNFGDTTTSTLQEPLHQYQRTGPFAVQLSATSQVGCAADTTVMFDGVYAQPVANFSYKPQICVSDSIQFLDQSTAAKSAVAGWIWQFANGKNSTLQNPFVKFDSAGTYQITLAIKTAVGCADTVTKSIVVNSLPIADFAPAAITCSNAPIAFADRSTVANSTVTKYEWNFGDGTSAIYSNNDAFNKSYATAGNYTVSLVVTSASGCISDTTKKSLAVKTSPVTNFIVPQVCINDPFATFLDSSYGGGPQGLKYYWDFDTSNANVGDTANIRDPQYTYSKAGTYTVYHVTTDIGSGCSSAITKKVLISGAAIVPNFSLQSTSFCGNAPIILNNNASVDAGSIVEIVAVWDAQANPPVADTITAPLPGQLSHTFSPANTAKDYPVKLTAYSGKSCMSDTTILVTIAATPKITFGPVNNFCQQDASRQLIASESNGLPGNASFSGNGVTAGGSFNPTLAGVGTHNITYTYTSQNGCSDSASQPVKVFANPTIVLPQKVYLLQGGNLQLQPVVSGNITRYVWSPATYLNNSNIKDPTTTAPNNISYQLTVTTADGCAANASVTVVMLQSLNVTNAFSPNGDGINDVWNIPALSSYPNAVVEVFNRYGKLVYHSVGYPTPWDGTYNGQVLPVGVYYFIIDPKNGKERFTGSITIMK